MSAHADTTEVIALSDAEQETLRCMVGHIVPASSEFGVPGADDPAIFADILRSVGRYEAELREALRIVDAAAGGRLWALPGDQQVALLARFRAGHPALAGAVGAVTARCYYRDDRVMAAIGMEVRAPYPLGFKVEEGDLSLLDPVRLRGMKYRDAG